ncbi:MAG: sugar transferase [Chitinophagaceae bacterium]
MELTSLPTKSPTAKTYKHFTIETYPVNDTYSTRKIEFLYIGKESRKVDFLIQTFDGGYTSETIHNAISILKRISDTHAIPDIFIIDAQVTETSLKEFHKYVSSRVSLSLVPMVIDASDLTEAELNRFTKFSFLDEIVFLGETSQEKFLSKVEFLKKIKKQANQQLLTKNIQTSVNPVLGSPWTLKRVFDIVISFLAIVILSPVFLLIGILIMSESKGPVFYISKRAGRGYNIFDFYKFRTMIIDADKKVSQLAHLNQYTSKVNAPLFFKISNDPRITKVGAFLRNTSLDELPQLFNVLCGDMSLVGNRPLPLYEAATLTTDEWAARFMAPAGITGLWQIKKRGDKNMSAEERISLDIEYAEKFNFVYDLWIMASTPSALFQKDNV